MNISINDLAREVQSVLEDCQREAMRACDETIDSVSKEALRIARENAPKRHGDYQKSLTRKKTKDQRGNTEYVIHSKDEASLSHLLENGHASRNGGFVDGKPHFKPALDYASEQIETEFSKHFK